jgi:hypothetical protein
MNGFSWYQDRSESPYGACGWIRYEVVQEQAPALPAAELFAALAALGPRALAILTELAKRLARGAAEHGDFENLDRDWGREALEEDLDGMVYRTVALMRREGKL